MKPISELSPLEIREAVATRVMGWEPTGIDTSRKDGEVWHYPKVGFRVTVPHYESEIDPAFEVVAKMREKGYHFEMEYGPGENSVCYATFSMYGSRGHARLLPVPLAIATAALEATGSAK